MAKTKKKTIAKLDNKLNALSNQMRKATIAHAAPSQGSPKKKKQRSRNRAKNTFGIAQVPQNSRSATDCVMTSPEQGEFISTINGSTTFVDTIFDVNPGSSVAFPWLSTIAQNYNRYRFESLEFVYKPQVSPYANSGQSGKIVLAFNPDVVDAGSTTLSGLENMSPTSDGMPYQTITLRVSAKDLQNLPHYFVRGNVMPPGDPKTYDCGALHVGVGSTNGTTVLGELRVKYRVRFSNPISTLSTQNTPGATSIFYATGTSTTNAGDGILRSVNVASAPGSNANMFVNNSGLLSVLFPGVYTVVIEQSATCSAGDLTTANGELRLNGTAYLTAVWKTNASNYGSYNINLGVVGAIPLRVGDTLQYFEAGVSAAPANTHSSAMKILITLVD